MRSRKRSAPKVDRTAGTDPPAAGISVSIPVRLSEAESGSRHLEDSAFPSGTTRSCRARPPCRYPDMELRGCQIAALPSNHECSANEPLAFPYREISRPILPQEESLGSLRPQAAECE